MAKKGFYKIPLSLDARVVLKVFNKDGECVCPQIAVSSLMSTAEANKAVQELKRQQLITTGAPYKLTKLGFKYLKEELK